MKAHPREQEVVRAFAGELPCYGLGWGAARRGVGAHASERWVPAAPVLSPLEEHAQQLCGAEAAGDLEARTLHAEVLARAALREERGARQLVEDVLTSAQAHAKNKEALASALSHYHVPLWAAAREALESCLRGESKYLFLAALQALLRDRWEAAEQELQRLSILEGRRELAKNLLQALSDARR